MSKRDKLLNKFLHTPIKRDLTFGELETLLIAYNYVKIEGSGSSIKFYNKQKNSLINLHKPHPNDILKVYLVKQMKLKDL